jgi:hypothetical protein
MFCGHAHYFRRADYQGCQVCALAEASDEYYILDTATGELARLATEAVRLTLPQHPHTPTHPREKRHP